ncbi:hypothetical protein Tco_0014631 [Tanacetum coccineum]
MWSDLYKHYDVAAYLIKGCECFNSEVESFGHVSRRLGCAAEKVATWDDLAFKLIILRSNVKHSMLQKVDPCMAPSGSRFLLFDVHYNGIFNFKPLRYENGLVYTWSVPKDRELDLTSAHEFLREETPSIIL